MDGVQASVHRLFEQMYDEIARPTLNRAQLRALTDQLTTQVMMHAVPGKTDGVFDVLGFTASELRVAEFMHRRMGRFVAREDLLHAREVPRSDPNADIKIVDVYICKIRRKLAGTEFCIENVYGRGYRMMTNADTLFLTDQQIARQELGERDAPVSREGLAMSEPIAKYFDILAQGRAFNSKEISAVTGDNQIFLRSRLAQLRSVIAGSRISLRSTFGTIGRRWQLVEFR